MLIRGDSRQLPLVDGCVDCVVTSPPYWGLRDYGHGEQIGLESTPEAYVASLVGVFREVRRVLRDDGTVWLNLGDSYAAARGGTKMPAETLAGGIGGHALDGLGDRGRGAQARTDEESGFVAHRNAAAIGLKHKDIVGIPWRVAFALQADGWYLRSDIIWSKPNPMPESVTDRPTKAHEYIFLLSKSARYVYDADAIREDSTPDMQRRALAGHTRGNGTRDESRNDAATLIGGVVEANGRNKRSVWTVATMPYSGAHFATMPEKLVEPCILAGCPPAGKRCDCDEVIATPIGDGATDDPTITTGRAGFNRPRRPNEGTRPITRREQRDYAEQMRVSPFREQMAATTGVAFAHYIRTDRSGARPAPPDLLTDWLGRGWLREPAPCTHPYEPAGIVLDPFIGSGTVGAVAERFGRRWVGVDLSYQHLAKERTAQRGIPFGGDY